MKCAYIGILSRGSTSRMRAECLRRVTAGDEWAWIDTDEPFQRSARLWRTLAFRTGTGAAVSRINNAVCNAMSGKSYDLVWVDKALFLNEETVRVARKAARRLVHFTPDTAFHENRARNFVRSMPLYDLLVTTKSFELDAYRMRAGRDTVLLTTQGFDPQVHYSRNEAGERRHEAVFIGLAEPDRERCVALLLEQGVPVRVGGLGWKGFLRRWRGHSGLTFEGEQIFGDAYARLLSQAWVGLGLISKRFPELHTTRTFEIPACGALLATESNSETRSFFETNEALFFSDYASLAAQLASTLHPASNADLKAVASAGERRVKADGRDYESILLRILGDPRVSG